MLIYFKVANYKSIKDPLVINFNAASISEHIKSNVVNEESLTVLKTIMLYGHNASGKSKILDAFVFFRNFVINSAIEKQRNEPIDVEPFQLSEATIDAPSFFEASFIIDKTKYRYGFEADRVRIHREWLLESKATKEYPAFLRIEDDFQIDKKRFSDAAGLERRTRKNALFLSVSSQWNVTKAEKINEWFASIYTIHGLMDEEYRQLTIDFLKNDTYHELINKFVQKADLGINAINVTEVSVKPEMDQTIPDAAEVTGRFDRSSSLVLTFHNKYDKENNVIGSMPFLLDENESEGTKKYFNLIGVFVSALLENRLVVMDEFDARFHTLLTKSILKLFNSPVTKSKAQLFVASHDSALLDRNLLRRDQIYFVEKSRYGATEVTSLVEFRPRKETPYYKNYLEGKYGAIPIIDDLESLITDGKKEEGNL